MFSVIFDIESILFNIKGTEKSVLRPGAKKIIDFLSVKEIKMGAISSAPLQNLKQDLSELGILNNFDSLVSRKEINSGDQDMCGYLLATRKLGVPPENCFVFDNTLSGIKEGHSLGMKCIVMSDCVKIDKNNERFVYTNINSFDDAIKILSYYLKKR